METEQLVIFTEKMERIGVRTRAEIHEQGYWHETFHCWFVQEVEGKAYLLFQKRAAQKKDFPSLLDITAAGHLLSHESPRDGLREIQEELGLTLSFTDLVPAGIIQDPILLGSLLDREFCHVYLYMFTKPIPTLVLQRDEVAAIVQIALHDFEQLLQQRNSTIPALVYLADPDDTQKVTSAHYTLTDFCPHNTHYYNAVLHGAEQLLRAKR
ncbi:putative Nudix hydrolase [Dictyobacter alpinus]|uniref:Putative Nudix hydrolase n=1 Tax=Dictyobacter alpinus TaxID=2014873 RepID=A0A402BIH0_9CHLR|nr:NUDIX domain-containing protein [Dictyobacter alpinus]GCE31139.1 putative Nudix hydrolase [Dictyobacter alpinus]